MPPYETALGQAAILLGRLEDLQAVVLQIVVEHALPDSLGFDLTAGHGLLEVGLRGTGAVEWHRVDAIDRVTLKVSDDAGSLALNVNCSLPYWSHLGSGWPLGKGIFRPLPSSAASASFCCSIKE